MKAPYQASDTADKSASQTAITVNHRNLIASAFRDLRNIGFIAKANFMCCQGCGWADIRNSGGNEGSNIVFYHKQDGERFDRNGSLRESIYIAHQGDTMKAVDALRLKGLIVQWDGKREHRIKILPRIA